MVIQKNKQWYEIERRKKEWKKKEALAIDITKCN